MDTTVLSPNEWIVVFYPTTGALRLHPSLDAAKHSISPHSWPLHIYRSPLDFKHRHDHFALERFWNLVYKNCLWRMPRLALGNLEDWEPQGPDLPTEEFSYKLWEFFQAVGDRVTKLSIHKTKSRFHYELHLDKMRKLASDEVLFKQTYNKQQRVIFTRLCQMQSPYMMEIDLKKMMLELLASRLLKTKQDSWLIFQYYRPQFIKDGFISRGSDPTEEDDNEYLD